MTRGSGMPISAVPMANSGAAMPPERSHDAGPRTLAELEARVARELELLIIPPAKEWLEPRMHPQWGPLLDVAIIGAGRGGLGTGFVLWRLGVRRLRWFEVVR